MLLTGWVRLGIVLTMIWFLVVAALVTFEYVTKRRGSGIVVSWEQSKPKPWEIDWSKNPPAKGQVFDADAYLRSQGMSQAQIDAMPFVPLWNQERLLGLLLGVPACVWLITILGVRATRWVVAGFR